MEILDAHHQSTAIANLVWTHLFGTKIGPLQTQPDHVQEKWAEATVAFYGTVMDLPVTQAFFQDNLQNLIKRAEDAGYVLTISNEPLKPLAQGNHKMIGSVRPVISTIREQMAAERK